MERRSADNFVRIAIEGKRWARGCLPVDAARPAHCPRCERESRTPGGGIVLHGHGWRERQQRGPVSPGEPPSIVGLELRRYRCRECGAVVTTAPETVAKHKLYSAAAIGWALALFGVLKLTAAAVRQRTSPWRIVGLANPDRWASLRRWACEVKARRLFRKVRACPVAFTLRQVAERTAMTLAACAPSHYATAPPAAQAFFGAARAQ